MQHLQKDEFTRDAGEWGGDCPASRCRFAAVRRRFARRINAILQRIIPAFLGLGLLVVLCSWAAINSKGFRRRSARSIPPSTLFCRSVLSRDGPNDMVHRLERARLITARGGGLWPGRARPDPARLPDWSLHLFPRMFVPADRAVTPGWPAGLAAPSACCCSRKRSPRRAGPFSSAPSGRW